jgi:hypothetical protein
MPKLQRQGGVVLSPSHQRQFLSRSGLYQTLAYGCRTSPLGGAKYFSFKISKLYQNPNWIRTRLKI